MYRRERAIRWIMLGGNHFPRFRLQTTELGIWGIGGARPRCRGREGSIMRRNGEHERKNFNDLNPG